METSQLSCVASKSMDEQWACTLVDHEATLWVESQREVEFLITVLASVTSLETESLQGQW